MASGFLCPLFQFATHVGMKKMNHRIVKMKRAAILAAALFVAAGAMPGRAQTAATSTNTHWQSSVNVGGSLTRGNSDTTLFSAGITTEKKWRADSLAMGADGLYGESKLSGQSKSTETADQLHGFAQYNRTISTNFYGYGRAEGLHDGIADVQYRLTLAPGAGYYIIKNPRIDLSVEAAPSYITEKLDGHYESYAALRLAQKFHWAISPKSKYWETIEYLPQVDQFGNYIVNFETGVEAALNNNNKLTLRTVLQDTYNNAPALNHLKNDLKLIVGIAYKF